MIRRPPRSTQSRSSAASDVYKRQVLTVVVPEDVAPVRQSQRVDGPAVVEVERHADQQFGDRIDDALDRQGLSAAPEGAVAALHQRRAFQPSHSAHASCGTAAGRLKIRCRPIVPYATPSLFGAMRGAAETSSQ